MIFNAYHFGDTAAQETFVGPRRPKASQGPVSTQGPSDGVDLLLRIGVQSYCGYSAWEVYGVQFVCETSAAIAFWECFVCKWCAKRLRL